MSITPNNQDLAGFERRIAARYLDRILVLVKDRPVEAVHSAFSEAKLDYERVRHDPATVREPRMVVSQDPMLTRPLGRPGAGGYREHERLVGAEDGAENINGFPDGPEHNIIAA